ncbi:LysM peptidoglycan-binding domain-containing protein [Palleronia abyssalis]|uniref:Murein hydrolase activator NlpD n=1 Tax=Palleronia abyssalis TaxID=1501240 RepID=A0A2R8BW46_9RHOB|nr:LysM peptidoglycan-binding domain-containing protein [Palleronia abyssalis]SPJ24286.1 Murein hydrolase activator NlpD [Palleronia abyssalis]
MIRTTPVLPLAAIATLGLTACTPSGFDMDLRDRLGIAAFDTTPAVQQAVQRRPEPDNRGVISYPDYQVAVARNGDTVASLSQRLGLNAQQVAEYNGLPSNVGLRRGELIALPARVSEPSAATGAPTAIASATASIPATTPIATVPLDQRASTAIDRAEGNTPAATPAAVRTPSSNGTQPTRHRVERGETAFSIARRYDVPVSALAEWNGLDDQMTVRTGSVLLIPVVDRSAPVPDRQASQPGQGTVAPPPPSAAEPLPAEEANQAPPKETPPSPALQQQTTSASASGAQFVYPVQGSIVRAYSKGRNDGIDIAAPAGTTVKAAGSGTVAAITRDTEQVPILVLRHPGNLLTVYAGVSDITVAKGDSITKGQSIAKVRAGDPAFLHFEVREGFESVDPSEYLD